MDGLEGAIPLASRPSPISRPRVALSAISQYSTVARVFGTGLARAAEIPPTDGTPLVGADGARFGSAHAAAITDRLTMGSTTRMARFPLRGWMSRKVHRPVQRCRPVVEGATIATPAYPLVMPRL